MGPLQEQDIPILILMGTTGMLILIGGIAVFILLHQRRILKEKQNQALQALDYQDKMIKLQLESQEQERKRIGADLHDSLGSLLWGAKVNATFIQRTVGVTEATLTSFYELNEILDEGIEAVRRIAWELTPDAFHYAGLSESVMKICERLNGKGTEVVLTSDSDQLWNDDRALTVFRIIQELINNAMKHSKASTVTISLCWEKEELKIVVSDNGIGLKINQGRKGVGFWNMEQRMKQLKGKIQIGNSPTSTGTKISLVIPLVL